MPVSRLIRYLRTRRRHWSPESDRAFHDAAFAQGPADPFSDSYTGYITIRRFADLAGERLGGATRVLDLGCGPGEITCELAARFPSCRFEGIDHSPVAVERARANAARRHVDNACFAVGDSSHPEAFGRCDLVLMFDSFHHLLDPAGFVGRLAAVTDRVLLIEPGGTPSGAWQRGIDLDWLAMDLDAVRAHLEHVLGDEPRTSNALTANAPAPVDETGEAVEYRYAVADFERFFAGFGVDIRGTVAGIVEYPRTAAGDSPLRQRLGRFAYEVFAEVDAELRRRDRDMLAKHWVVYAERGATFPRRVVPGEASPTWRGDRPRGAFEAQFIAYDGPQVLAPGATAVARVAIENSGWRTWDSTAAVAINVSYHWWSPDRVEVERDGVRTPLPRPVPPGEAVEVALRVVAPGRPGRYLLAVDLVEEGVAWFSDAGLPPLTVEFRVR